MHLGRDHGGVGPDPSHPQHRVLGRLGQQRLVELVDYLTAADIRAILSHYRAPCATCGKDAHNGTEDTVAWCRLR